MECRLPPKGQIRIPQKDDLPQPDWRTSGTYPRQSSRILFGPLRESVGRGQGHGAPRSGTAPPWITSAAGIVVGGDATATRKPNPARPRRQLVPVARLVPEKRPIPLPEGDRHGDTSMDRKWASENPFHAVGRTKW
jgi:hypothetical protein